MNGEDDWLSALDGLPFVKVWSASRRSRIAAVFGEPARCGRSSCGRSTIRAMSGRDVLVVMPTWSRQEPLLHTNLVQANRFILILVALGLFSHFLIHAYASRLSPFGACASRRHPDGGRGISVYAELHRTPPASQRLLLRDARILLQQSII